MTNTTTAADLEIRPRSTADDPRLLEIYLQYEEVFRLSLDEWRFHFDERARQPGKEPVMRVGEVLGRLAGDWYIEPHYSGAAGVFVAVVEVDKAETGKGYGALLWEDAQRYLLAHGVTKVYHSLPENLEAGKRFASARGFAPTGRADRISRLTLDGANLEGYEGLGERMAALGVTIKTVAELDTDDDAFMRELHAGIMEMLADIPRSEEAFESQPYDVWRVNFLKSPGSSAEAYWIALHDGHPVGMANLQDSGGQGVLNGLTGVVRTHRHKGIARALKLKTIEWSRARGFPHIDTANDAANAAMLSINLPLGYHALPAREEWLKEYT